MALLELRIANVLLPTSTMPPMRGDSRFFSVILFHLKNMAVLLCIIVYPITFMVLLAVVLPLWGGRNGSIIFGR